jgi:hypothetical protein
MEEKECQTCHRSLPLSEFNNRCDGRKHNRPRSYCRECYAVYMKDWRKKSREKDLIQYRKKEKEFNIKTNYGISLTDYNQMVESQDGKCYICGINKDSLTRKLAVDHNEKTGQVRALLCTNCNTALGLFKENTVSMFRAIEYLKVFN